MYNEGDYCPFEEDEIRDSFEADDYLYSGDFDDLGVLPTLVAAD